ncbi:MAG TPA: tetratricopeptide repeat protein [Actinospica sp.]|nr:tetratricopeptide repeat protein [Actinospica sp.]
MATHWAPLPAGLNPAARRLIGELRALKDDHGISLAQLSTSTHYSRASWERWLNGKRLITSAALTAIATRFGADLVLLATLRCEARLDDAPEDAPPDPDAGHGTDQAAADADDDAVPPPAQLPASTADFTGRRSQVEDLCAALLPGTGDPGQVSVAAITGGGGLGKTTLAVHVGHRIAERFPDGQLYVDLLGAGENALTPETVLAQWLRALGDDPAELPADPAERAARYRSVLSRSRVLVVLDNARDAEQVRPLLPANNGCAVLITSRNRLAELPGAYKLGLSSLPDEDALILLAQLVGAGRLAAEPEATAELLRACGGIPLALRIAGARLGARTSWPVSTLARRLSDQRRRLDELAIGDLAARASFQVSYAALAKAGIDGGASPERAFRLLGLAAGPDISLPAAAALLGLAEDHAELVLEGLVDTHLLESPEPDRYRMHDLVRLYAAEQAALDEPESARTAAVGRLTGWYLATAARSHLHLSPQSRPVPVDGLAPAGQALEFATYQQAMDWCERERPNLVAAVLQAAEYGCNEACWKLAAAMLGFFNARRYLADWTATHVAALGAAQAADDLVGEAWIQNNLGFVYFYWAETQRKALECFERSLELRVLLGDRLGEAIALNNIGGAYHRLGDHAEAIRRLEEASRIREELGDELGVGQACLNIGCILTDQRELAAAESYLLRALRITDKLGNVQLYIKCLNTLGDVYAGLGRTSQAKQHLHRSLELSRELRELDGEATAMQNLARTHYAEGDIDAALRCWEQALELYERYDDPQAETVRAEMAEADAGGVR